MSIIPYLCVADARRAIDWYVTVLGARVTYQPIVMDDGRIGHAEFAIGDAAMMMAEPFPELGVKAPDPTAGVPVSLQLLVDEVDPVARAAAEAGAVLDRGPESTDHGRVAVLRDPFGHRWMLTDGRPA